MTSPSSTSAPLEEIVAAWYAALEDPGGNALRAFCCDRLAIPHPGAAQPITPAILDRSRRLGLAPEDASPQDSAPYPMSWSGPTAHSPPNPPLRVAGLDLGPRCWFWCDEILAPSVTACVWAELIASENASTRLPLLMDELGVSCVLLDAGGEPDLAKRLVLSLNGLDRYHPPNLPREELLKLQLYHLGDGKAWDGVQGRWKRIRAAAVLFVAGEGGGLQQTVGFTQDGLMPLDGCSSPSRRQHQSEQ